MSSVVEAALSRRHTSLLLFLAVFLAVAVFTLQYFLPARPFQLAAAGALVVVAGMLILSYPKHGLMLTIFYIYSSMTYFLKIHAGWPIAGLVATAALLGVLRGEPIVRPTAAFNWVAAIFSAMILTSFLFIWDLGLAIGEATRFFRTLIMVYLFVHLLSLPRDLQRVVTVMYVSVFVTVLLGVLGLKFGFVEVAAIAGGPQGFVRLGSSYGDPNSLAVFTIAMVPYGVFLLRQHHGRGARTAIGFMLLALILASFSTFSRAAIFPLGFVAVAILFRDARAKYAVPSLVVVVGLVTLLTPQHYWDRLASLGQLASEMTLDWSLKMRTDALKAAWTQFVEHPFTGVGVGNLVAVSPDLVVRMVAHNAYLEVLVSVGIFGLAAYMAMLFVPFLEFRKAGRAQWQPEYSWLRHLSFYSLISFLSVLMGIVFLSWPFEYVVWLSAAMGLALGRMATHFAIQTDAET
jgi:O-antigen ligase